MKDFGTIQFTVTGALIKRYLMSDAGTMSDFMDELFGIRDSEDSNRDMAHYFIEKWVKDNMDDIAAFVMSGEMMKEGNA